MQRFLSLVIGLCVLSSVSAARRSQGETSIDPIIIEILKEIEALVEIVDSNEIPAAVSVICGPGCTTGDTGPKRNQQNDGEEEELATTTSKEFLVKYLKNIMDVILTQWFYHEVQVPQRPPTEEEEDAMDIIN